ncbi:uncharacterized protein DNG_07478 [Cephalotrichum gorgonifer]|uniref:Uncharacterized protein n=1 Tax=Cephalotrichum gorgonifer TaxID=2041049 RepID=A0AAE8N4A7_9PEZI|nr:uncharacterized protein DNG_07478 [Cephalotrichum gorgonifer]
MSDHEANGGHPTPPRHKQTSSPSPSLSSGTQYQTPPSRGPRPVSYGATPPLPLSPDSVISPSRDRPISDYFPARRSHAVRFVDPTVNLDDSASTLGPLEQYPAHSPTIDRSWTGQHSEDESAYSEASDANTTSTFSAPRKRKRRTARSGTRYQICQPATHLAKRHRRLIPVRTTLLLQLQQLTDTRPKPAFDVLPAGVLRGSLKGSTKLARRIPKPFGHRQELGSDDVILTKSENYDSNALDDSDDGLENRELLAIISPRPAAGDGCTDIVLANGTIWAATPLPSGSYEFSTLRPEDGSIITARWAKRKISLEDDDDYKYTFSIIDPSSRRHPIMGTLTPSMLEVLDNYTTVSPHSASRHPPTRRYSFDANGTAPVRTERATLPIDEATRSFITVSGVWISLLKLGFAVAPKGPAPCSMNHAANGGTATNHTTKVSSPTTLPPRRNGALPVRVPSPALSGHGAGDVRRRWTINGKKRPDSGLPAPVEAEEVPPADRSVEAEGHGKRRLYTRIKRVFGIGRGEER